jgi:hypothetical protein
LDYFFSRIKRTELVKVMRYSLMCDRKSFARWATKFGNSSEVMRFALGSRLYPTLEAGSAAVLNLTPPHAIGQSYDPVRSARPLESARAIITFPDSSGQLPKNPRRAG